MIDHSAIDAALAPVANGRATARLEDGRASIILDVSGLDIAERDALEGAVRDAVAALPGIDAVRIAMTSERTGRRLIAVASGKGGVGKSTVSANLAVALARTGRRVGMVDADIYGPSQPKLLSAEDARAEARDKQLLPVATPYGVPMLSMGQLVAQGQAIAWRGPMAAGALGQLVDARWGDTDTLVVDMPPGTGDVALSLSQLLPLSGAVVVCTPQDVALLDAVKAISMFRKVNIEVAGMVENMSFFSCPHCKERSEIFRHGGTQRVCEHLGVPFLGEIPIEPQITLQGDAGIPIVIAEPDSPSANAFFTLAGNVAAKLSTQVMGTTVSIITPDDYLYEQLNIRDMNQSNFK